VLLINFLGHNDGLSTWTPDLAPSVCHTETVGEYLDFSKKVINSSAR
jgi:hypothetical protein